MWKLNTPWDNPWVNKDISRAKRKQYELCENRNTTWNLQDSYTEIKALNHSRKKTPKNNLSSHLKNLEREKQIKPKISIEGNTKEQNGNQWN